MSRLIALAFVLSRLENTNAGGLKRKQFQTKIFLKVEDEETYTPWVRTYLSAEIYELRHGTIPVRTDVRVHSI